MEQYFGRPELISLGILIVDARHRPTDDDVVMADWFFSTGRPVAVVANKTDKLAKNALDGSIETIRQTLGLTDGRPVIPFSAEKGTNKGLLISEIEKTVMK